jgi:hypothetical protein
MYEIVSSSAFHGASPQAKWSTSWFEMAISAYEFFFGWISGLRYQLLFDPNRLDSSNYNQTYEALWKWNELKLKRYWERFECALFFSCFVLAHPCSFCVLVVHSNPSTRSSIHVALAIHSGIYSRTRFAPSQRSTTVLTKKYLRIALLSISPSDSWWSSTMNQMELGKCVPYRSRYHPSPIGRMIAIWAAIPYY